MVIPENLPRRKCLYPQSDRSSKDIPHPVAGEAQEVLENNALSDDNSQSDTQNFFAPVATRKMLGGFSQPGPTHCVRSATLERRDDGHLAGERAFADN